MTMKKENLVWICKFFAMWNKGAYCIIIYLVMVENLFCRKSLLFWDGNQMLEAKTLQPWDGNNLEEWEMELNEDDLTWR